MKEKIDLVSVRLVKDYQFFSDKPINTAQDAINLVADYLKEMDREVFAIINMNNKGYPINVNVVSIGTIDETICNPREVFKTAILSNAKGIIAMHCHPSGITEPSMADTQITDKLIKSGYLLGIDVLDHIIVGANNNEYFSFQAKGLITLPSLKYEENYMELDFNDCQLVAES